MAKGRIKKTKKQIFAAAKRGWRKRKRRHGKDGKKG